MRLFAGLLDLVLPVMCVGCGQPGRVWCAACATRLAHPRPICLPGLPTTWTAGPYEGPIVAAIHEWKEQGCSSLTIPFAAPLAQCVAELLADVDAPDCVALVPIASSSAAVRRRGYDALGDLAGEVVSRLSTVGIAAVVHDSLRPARERRDQAGLDLSQRSRNMSNSLRVASSPTHPVVIIDDIVTTGATLREAFRVLRPQQQVLGCATLTATAKRHLGARPMSP